jgi:tungstate transport system permease protein
MSDFGEAFALALAMLARLDANLLSIIYLSLWVSLSALAIATCFGLPAGTALAIYRFPGRGVLVLLVNAMLGLPPVVVGLAAYLLLSRAGPLGSFGLLFTPGAMVIVQTVLVLPIIAALVHRAMEETWARYGHEFQILGATRRMAIPELLKIGQRPVLTALLAGFGRAISEVGAIIIVGGNIAGLTRTMTTTIVLETSKGNLALALALGIVLISISIAVNGLAFALAARRYAS